MAAPVYSKRFFAISTVPGTPEPHYTVPAGSVAILHDLEVFYFGSTVGTLLWLVLLPSFQVVQFKSAAAGWWSQWQGRIVFQAGESFGVYGAPGDEWNAIASGMVLLT
jgi:hypothetical protein